MAKRLPDVSERFTTLPADLAARVVQNHVGKVHVFIRLSANTEVFLQVNKPDLIRTLNQLTDEISLYAPREEGYPGKNLFISQEDT